jgi:hypothetical protein
MKRLTNCFGDGYLDYVNRREDMIRRPAKTLAANISFDIYRQTASCRAAAVNGEDYV